MNGLLVIGYGNTLRSDDGAGIRAAELIAAAYPGVECITAHQLEPGLAETISGYASVIFIDAATGIGELTAMLLSCPGGDGGSWTHYSTPDALLDLCRTSYCASPRALLIKIPLWNDGFGETCSPETTAAIWECVRRFPEFSSVVQTGENAVVDQILHPPSADSG